MDTGHSATFLALAAIAVAAALVAAVTRRRTLGAAALGALALATGLLLADLSAGFAALLVFLLLLGAAGATLAAPVEAEQPAARRDQAGALAAVLIFAALAYAAYRGAFHSARFPGGSFDAAALGRHLLAHDPLSLLAAGAAVLIGTGFGATNFLRGRSG